MSQVKSRVSKLGGDSYKLDPRRDLFKENYIDPHSPTFSNAQQSAIKAGFSETYARTITGQGTDWFCEIIRDQEMIEKAERNLDEFLDEPEDKKIKADITKFVASRLRNDKWGDKRTVDHQSKGEPLKIGILDGVSSSDSNEEDHADGQEDQGTSRGDSSEQDDQCPAILDSPGSDG